VGCNVQYTYGVYAMYAALVVAAAIVSAQPPVKTTALEALHVCRFNAALSDEVLMHRWVDLTGVVTEIERDGIGGYILRIDAATHEPDFIGRIEFHCYFTGVYRTDLAKIRPGVPVTLRGIVRDVRDHLHFTIDKNLLLTMRNCEILAGAE
jgi:hypothetical protein